MFSAILDQLGQKASLADRARCFGLLGAALQDVSPPQAAGADREPVKWEPRYERYETVADAVTDIFDRERSRAVDITVAIEAAEALGQAGDPRFHPGHSRKELGDDPGG